MPFVLRHFTPPSRRLRTFLRANRFFLIGVAILILILIYVLVTRQQGDMLVAINGLRTPFLDRFFIAGTQLGEPIAYVVVLLVALTFRLRTAIFVVLTGAAAGIISAIFKVIFSQARPMRWFFDNMEDVWHALNKFDEPMRNWGFSSFPSGHATSAFALFSFVCFNVRRPKVGISIVCFLIAAQVAFSRMYLLFHFWRDITAGAVLGLLIGVGMFFLQWVPFPESRFLNNGIWWSRRREIPPVSDDLTQDD